MKSLMTENKNARGKVNYKSADDVQREIERLQKQVDTGMMKLVDEKKALSEVTSLHKQKKNFTGFDATEKRISDVKAQIAELRKTLDDPESKALSDRYTEINSELDKIKAEQDEVYGNLNKLRDERTKAHEDQQTKYAAVKDIKDKYYQAKRASAIYEKEAYQARKNKQKADRDLLDQNKRRQAAEQRLEDASALAYADEILTTQGLIRYFDPSSAEAKAAAAPGKFAAQASRTVDDSGLTGTRLLKKGGDDEDYFIGSGGKKGKKGRKGRDSPAPTGTEKFNLSIGVIEELAKVNVEPPMNQGDVPSVVEKLKERLAHWKGDQDRKTKEVSFPCHVYCDIADTMQNTAKAQKEIDEIDAAAKKSGDAESSAQTNGQSAAGSKQEETQDSATQAAEDLSTISIENGHA